MLKITMPIYTATFPQDFLKVIFSPLRIAYDPGEQGGPWPPLAPLRIAYDPGDI